MLVLCSTPVQLLFNQRLKVSKPIRAKRELDAILECIGVEIQGSENARSQKSFDREAAKA